MSAAHHDGTGGGVDIGAQDAQHRPDEQPQQQQESDARQLQY
jgi:hypothetical protein